MEPCLGPSGGVSQKGDWTFSWRSSIQRLFGVQEGGEPRNVTWLAPGLGRVVNGA